MTDDARTNLLAAIAEKATTADVADISTLATAYQQVVHGPQGGTMDTASKHPLRLRRRHLTKHHQPPAQPPRRGT